VGIICPFPVEIGLTILKIRVRQMLGCLTIDYAPGKYVLDLKDIFFTFLYEAWFMNIILYIMEIFKIEKTKT